MGNTEYAQWYVMRDLKRCNAKKPAYKQLQEAGVKVFVPLKWQIILQKGKKVREKVPVIQDLLFVYDSRQHLDSIVERTKTLQYRWLRNTFRFGNGQIHTSRQQFRFTPILFAGRNNPSDVRAQNSDYRRLSQWI